MATVNYVYINIYIYIKRERERESGMPSSSVVAGFLTLFASRNHEIAINIVLLYKMWLCLSALTRDKLHGRDVYICVDVFAPTTLQGLLYMETQGPGSGPKLAAWAKALGSCRQFCGQGLALGPPYVCMCTHMYSYVYICVHIYPYMHIHICIYICIYIYIYYRIYICIHI